MKTTDTIATIRKLKRQDSLREKVLRGITNQNQLASAFGVSQKTISKDLDEIYEQILNESLDGHKVQKAFRIKQFESLATMALHEYDKSKEDTEETVIVYKTCQNCFGDGETEELPGLFDECPICKGKKQIKTEETIRTKGSKGESALLRVYKDCLTEIARIEGLYPRNAYKRQLEISAETVGGKIQLKTEELFLEAPSDTIIKAMSVLDELQEFANDKNAKMIEAKSKRVDVENPPDTEE